MSAGRVEVCLVDRVGDAVDWEWSVNLDVPVHQYDGTDEREKGDLLCTLWQDDPQLDLIHRHILIPRQERYT